MPNMVEKAIRLSLSRQAKGKQLLSNIPEAGMLGHLQTHPWGVSPGWFTWENVFLLAGTSGWSCWGQPVRLPFSQLQNPLAGMFFLFNQLSPFSPSSMDNLEPFWVSVLPHSSPKLPWKWSGWPFLFFFLNPTLLVNISAPWWEGDFLSIPHPMPHLTPADVVLRKVGRTSLWLNHTPELACDFKMPLVLCFLCCLWALIDIIMEP